VSDYGGETRPEGNGESTDELVRLWRDGTSTLACKARSCVFHLALHRRERKSEVIKEVLADFGIDVDSAQTLAKDLASAARFLAEIETRLCLRSSELPTLVNSLPFHMANLRLTMLALARPNELDVDRDEIVKATVLAAIKYNEEAAEWQREEREEVKDKEPLT
jgi:hypothetical protein